MMAGVGRMEVRQTCEPVLRSKDQVTNYCKSIAASTRYAWPDLGCPGGHGPGPPTSRGPAPK